jgi:DNA-binding transcriptional ArsR family regulator
MKEPPDKSHSWTFLSNHAHVLVTLAKDPSARLRDVAAQVGITERAVQRLVANLEEAGVLTKERDGRRNHYSIDKSCPLRHPLETHKTLGSLLRMVLDRNDASNA